MAPRLAHQSPLYFSVIDVELNLEPEVIRGGFTSVPYAPFWPRTPFSVIFDTVPLRGSKAAAQAKQLSPSLLTFLAIEPGASLDSHDDFSEGFPAGKPRDRISRLG